ncbi:MucR family transcriptional regulator [Mesorhizobium sp. PAMC28654]|uniref:MucR family transcriptional regulator n=1 Tax=Mesorhizobium sp. PAMC28654 TaxID=2880934 RepID=UPI001D0A4F0B|nr:MucR family transcriptional regulator [Mesorhizobium sp. PAMC28654]UDL87306.1 MucR family transcriptional regulator [Mesorhizobium sp. PAMC28654]
MSDENTNSALVELTAGIVSAYVSNNPVPAGELPAVIAQIHLSLCGLQAGSSPQTASEPLKPAVPIKKSVTPDFIISLEDGKKFKSLKRHLSTSYGMTPAEYREKWGLPADYPMVAANYAASRSELAKKIGLGRKPKEPAEPVAKKPTRQKSKS